MKICAFSDIHGNGPAFNAAWEQMRKENVERYIFLGDLCGYFFDQIEIFEKLVSLRNLSGVLGNHDQIYLKIMEGDDDLLREYTLKYGASMQVLAEKRQTSLDKWLAALPQESLLLDGDLMACHGSPWNLLEGYTYPDTSLETYGQYAPAIFLQGHTHYPMVRHAGSKTIINPGSLGQPRDGGWPTYAIVDTESGSVTFREVPYPKEEILKKIQAIDPRSAYLQAVINR